MKTTGNTILITGAGTGMGLEAAKQFSERGNKVVMVARNAERLEAEAARLNNAGAFACDIADRGQVDRSRCRLGAVRGHRRTGDTVIKQSPRPGLSRPSGWTVNVTID